MIICIQVNPNISRSNTLFYKHHTSDFEFTKDTVATCGVSFYWYPGRMEIICQEYSVLTPWPDILYHPKNSIFPTLCHKTNAYLYVCLFIYIYDFIDIRRVLLDAPLIHIYLIRKRGLRRTKWYTRRPNFSHERQIKRVVSFNIIVFNAFINSFTKYLPPTWSPYTFIGDVCIKLYKEWSAADWLTENKHDSMISNI